MAATHYRFKPWNVGRFIVWTLFALLLIAAPHKQVRWALVAAVVVLGIVLALGGVTVDGLAAAFVKLAHGGRGLGA